MGARRRAFRILSLALTGLALSAAVSAAAAAAPAKKAKSQVCADPRDMAALNTRVLQTELMVAALSCDERVRYNQFATTFQPVLIARADDLRTFFKKAGGTGRMNAMVTRLANDASQASQKRAHDYCQFASDLFEEVLNTPPQNINTVVDKPWITARHGYPACR